MKKIQYILFAAIFCLFSSLTVKAQNDLFLSFTIDPIATLEQLQDIQVKPSSGSASSTQSGQGIERSFDGDMSTLYHSEYGNVDNFPITLQYNFRNVEKIDYLIYHPRTSQTNGNFKEIEVWYKLEGEENEVKYNDYDFAGSSTASTVKFTSTLIDPEYIKIIVKSGVGDNNGIGFASCAEMEFYAINEDNVDLSEFFVDDIYSALQPGVTEEQILATENLPIFFKKLALELISGEYSPYRVQEYEAYRPVSSLTSEFKTSTYNQYENPTGIMVEPNKQIVVFVSDTNDETISLSCRNWETEATGTYSLKKGINYITPTITGHAYINYFTSNYETAQPIKIHIYGGQVNRVFKRGVHTNEDWVDILKNSVSDFIDIQGNFINLAYQTTGLKNYCPQDGEKLIELHDSIVGMQYDLMGLYKYNKVPKNHMFAANTYGSYNPYAGGLGAFFPNGSASAVCSPTNMVRGDNSWVIGHELGHVNQIRPGLRWVGTTECTNNVYSSYNQYTLTKNNGSVYLRLEHENCRDISGGVNVIGGRFNSYLHYGVLKGDYWQFQWGQDGESDHFVKLTPIWQLNLYFKIAESAPWAKPDWYADICEETRNTADGSFTNGQHQINFIKRACTYTETDLTEFFEIAGMFKPMDLLVGDYTSGRLTITEQMCNEVKEYVRENGWAKPAGLIQYMSGNTVEIFEQQLALEGTLNEGITVGDGYRTVSHSVWKNAVVYETYQGDELVRITMAGTGTTNNSSTRVPYPAGSTRIVAVSWDGVRETVYQP